MKVRGAEHIVALTKISTTPTWGQTTPIFARSRLLSQCSQEFLNERTNSESRVLLIHILTHIQVSTMALGLNMSQYVNK